MNWQDQLQALKPLLGTAPAPRPAKPPRKAPRAAPKPWAMPIVVEPLHSLQLAEMQARAEVKQIATERQAKRMELPAMTQAFSTPYTIERAKSHSTPIEFKSRHPKPTMTYDEAYEQASIAASELVSPNSPEWESTHNRILDELCVKHNIE